jgi:phage minor structural protein
MDIFIQSILGQIEFLTGFSVKRNNGVNGEKIIEVSGSKTEGNEHAYPLVQNENILIYSDDEYIIKDFRERTIGESTKVECKAIHRIFDDLVNNRIYETTTGTIRIEPLLDFTLEGSGYTFSVNSTDLPLSVEVQNFGDDNSLSLFKKVLEIFGAEFDVIGTQIYVGKQVGRLTDYQVRYKLNINNPSREINTNGFATYIRGFGKQNDDGTYSAYAEYTSPLASVYGIKHAPPIRDERYTDNASLLERIKRSLNDSIDVSIKLTYVELKEMGIQDIRKGDYVWCIIDPFDIDVQIRVIDVEDYSDPFKSPVFTLGTITKKASEIMANFNATKSAFEKVVDTQTNTVKQSALTTTTNYVIDAIERTFSQVDYNDDLSVSDPAVFMRKVGMRKGGIYRTVDGNYRYFVITPDGVNLSQVFGVLAADHVSIGPETTFAPGYDPTQILIPEYSLSTETSDGLMSKVDKKKLNQIVISELGQVVDLSILMQEINDLETENFNLSLKVDDLETRVAILEGGSI